MKAISRSELFRQLPSVDELLRSAELSALITDEGQVAVADAARAVLARLRQEIADGSLDGQTLELALAGLTAAVERQVRESLGYSLRPVINATGVILHTNLGRAPLSSSALDHARAIAEGYSNLEFNLTEGERGKRDVHVDRLFRKLLMEESSVDAASSMNAGQISTVVVNNNAAAVLIALNTLAEGGEVIVSRGELVEIGGSFRIPDVMAKSGAILREVGTTNRTRISDYERAISDKTRLLLRVHRSNFQITGFTEQTSLADLVELGHRRGIGIMEDLGSGALFDLQSVGVSGEPGVMDSIATGVDVVTYSGDKLLGGPQAGILSGKKDAITRIRSNPLFRALRVDKLTYAALEATLIAYVRQDHDAIPTLRMMRMTKEGIAQRAERVAEELQGTKCRIELVDGESVVGGGAAPGASLPTKLIAISIEGLRSEELAAWLRASDPPVIARIEEGRVLLDLRTVFPDQEPSVIAALKRVV